MWFAQLPNYLLTLVHRELTKKNLHGSTKGPGIQFSPDLSPPFITPNSHIAIISWGTDFSIYNNPFIMPNSHTAIRHWFLAGLQSNSGLWIDDVRLSVCLSVRLSVRPSVNIWLTSVFKFVLGHINQYRLDTLHGNRPWWDLLNCDLSLWSWPSLFCSRSLNSFG